MRGHCADFILDLASGAVTSAKLDEASARAHLVCCAELYAQVRWPHWLRILAPCQRVCRRI